MDSFSTGPAGYLIATLRDIEVHDELERYAAEVGATLIPYGGQFIVRGAAPELLEGSSPTEAVVIIAFPSLGHARQWYASDAYQAIRPLRTAHSAGELVLVEGVLPD